MAQIDSSGTPYAWAMTDVNLVNFGAWFNNSNEFYTWQTPSFITTYWTAYSFAGDIDALPPPSVQSGTINALNLQRTDWGNILSITDLNTTLPSLVDELGGITNEQRFWATVLAGATTIYAPEFAQPDANLNQSYFFGDFVTFSGGATTVVGGNDTMVGGSFIYSFVSGINTYNRVQNFAGDANLITAGTLRGGDDVITVGTQGIVIGDVVTLNGGTLIGGNDRITASGASFQQGIGFNYEAFVSGDAGFVSSGVLTGGNDTLTLSEITSVTTVSGDAGVLSSGAGTSRGGNDTISMVKSGTSANVETVVGDALDVGTIFTAGNDTITLSNFSQFSAGTISGDVTNVTAGALIGGADRITITGGVFDRVFGDAVNQIAATSVLGGADLMVFTNVFAAHISGDMFDGTSVGAAFRGGNDDITFTYNGGLTNTEFYGDGGTFTTRGNVTGGNDRITVNGGSSLAAFIRGDIHEYNGGALFTGGADVITYNGTRDSQISGDVFFVLNGSAVFGSDIVMGGSGNDELYGDYFSFSSGGSITGGNDTLNGRAGNDVLRGNEGNDTLIGELGNDNIDGGVGTDTAAFNTIARSVYVDLFGLPGSSGSTHAQGQGFDTLGGIENITGSILNDTIFGDNNANLLFGNHGDDRLSGRDGNDRLDGGFGNDILNGGNDNDVLLGGAGLDRMTGGAGNDTFVFNTALSASTNRDTITDFSPSAVGNNDVMHLENAIFTKLTKAGVLNAAFFRVGTAARDTNDHIIYNKTTGALIYDSNGIAPGGAIQFAILSTKPTLTASDFFVI